MNNSQIGQATFEFLLSLFISLGVIFFSFYLGIFYVRGFLVHYSGFLVARTYLVADPHSLYVQTTNYAQRQAEAVFRRLPLREFLITNANLGWNTLERSEKYQFVGPYINFAAKLFPMSLPGEAKQLNLRSEAFLGKEPTVGECAHSTCQAMEAFAGQICTHGQGSDSDASAFATVFDNGC